MGWLGGPDSAIPCRVFKGYFGSTLDHLDRAAGGHSPYTSWWSLCVPPIRALNAVELRQSAPLKHVCARFDSDTAHGLHII